MNDDDEKRVVGAMERIRATEMQLTNIQDGTVKIVPEREAELWDDLITLQMGIGPIRRKMATGEE